MRRGQIQACGKKGETELPLIPFNPYPAELIYLNRQPLEVVSHYRDSQPQVVENYSYLFNLRPNILKSWCLNTHFVPNNSDLIANKTDLKRD